MCCGILALVIMVGFLLYTGMAVANFWRRGTRGDEPSGAAGWGPGDEILALAYHPDDPGFGCRAIRGELVAREVPEGTAIEMVWRCGVAGCPGHATPEAASVHFDLEGATTP